MRSKAAAELQDQGLYDELKEELRRRLNQILPEDSIDAVYFTEFHLPVRVQECKTFYPKKK